jgi:hypothetical protein
MLEKQADRTRSRRVCDVWIVITAGVVERSLALVTGCPDVGLLRNIVSERKKCSHARQVGVERCVDQRSEPLLACPCLPGQKYLLVLSIEVLQDTCDGCCVILAGSDEEVPSSNSQMHF